MIRRTDIHNYNLVHCSKAEIWDLIICNKLWKMEKKIFSYAMTLGLVRQCPVSKTMTHTDTCTHTHAHKHMHTHTNTHK